MGAVAAAFGYEALAAGAAEAATATVAAEAGAAGAATMAGTAGTAAAGAAGGTAATSTLGAKLVAGAIQAGAGALIGQALAPDAPEAPPVVGMPDSKAQDEARRRSLAEQVTRKGRASTILTADTGNKLGG